MFTMVLAGYSKILRNHISLSNDFEMIIIYFKRKKYLYVTNLHLDMVRWGIHLSMLLIETINQDSIRFQSIIFCLFFVY